MWDFKTVVLRNLALWINRFPLRDFCNHTESNIFQQNGQCWRRVATQKLLCNKNSSLLNIIVLLVFILDSVNSKSKIMVKPTSAERIKNGVKTNKKN